MDPDAGGGSPLVPHLRRLMGHSAAYAAADVFGSALNLLLVPVYTTYLGAADYGSLALLLLFGTVAKIVFRLGLDAGFFRIHYDLHSPEDRRRLAGSVHLFAALFGGVLMLAVVASAPGLTALVFGGGGAPSAWVVLVAADVYLGCFAFVPLAILRIEDRSRLFSALAIGRHGLNTALKVLLLVRGAGLTGILWSDLLATAAFAAVLLPVLRGRAVPALSVPLLRQVLAFGLPKVPHGILVQASNLADRKILDLFVTRAEVGLYHVGYTFGTAVKFASSAFEPAWQPFVYEQLRRPDAARTLARVGTWAFAAFLAATLAVAGLGRELLTLLTPNNPAFRAAAPVIPVVALACLLHGVFLLGSVGIGIAKRAGLYPAITAAAAFVNLAANVLLVPGWGMMGAAWATVLAYAAMAALGLRSSQRLYPLPWEWSRLARWAAAALACYGATRLAPETLAIAVTMKTAALLAFPLLALALGAWRPGERRSLLRLLGWPNA